MAKEKVKKEKEESPHIIDSEHKFRSVNFVRNRIAETAASFKNFKSDFTDSLCLIFTNTAIAASFIGLIVLEIIFAAGGGYARAFEEVSANGLSFSPPTAEDNVYLMYSGIPGIIAEVLLILFAVTLIVHFYRHTGIVRRILMSAALALEAANVLFAALFLPYLDKVGHGEITVDAAQYELLESIYMNAPMGGAGNYFLIFGAIIAVFPAILLLTHSWSRRLFLHALPAIVLVFVVFPFLLYIIENIMALMSIAILLISTAVLLVFVFAFILGGSKSSPKTYTLSPREKLHKEGTIFVNIYVTDSSGTNLTLCSLDDFRTGEFIIYDSTGRRLSEDDIE